MMTPEQLRELADTLESVNTCDGNASFDDFSRAADYLRSCADIEPAAHMFPSDLEKFRESETFAQAYSIAVSNPDERSVPLYTHPAFVAQPSVYVDIAGWTKVADRHPKPHARYEVRRKDVGQFVATPCYGMHLPWWVPLVADVFAPGSIVIPFTDADEWRAVEQEPR